MLIPSFLHDHHSYIGNDFSENENSLSILENIKFASINITLIYAFYGVQNSLREFYYGFINRSENVHNMG